MSLTEKEVLHIAKLALLEVNPEEVVRLQGELNEILGCVEKLSSLPTRGVPPTSHVHGITNVFRDDVVQDSLNVEQLRNMAPDFVVSSFRVPRIL